MPIYVESETIHFSVVISSKFIACVCLSFCHMFIYLLTLGTFLKNSPLELPLASKTYEYLTPPAKSSCWVFVICFSNFLLCFLFYVYIFVKENHFSWVMMWLACLPVVNGGWLPHQTLWFSRYSAFPQWGKCGFDYLQRAPTNIYFRKKKVSW